MLWIGTPPSPFARQIFEMAGRIWTWAPTIKLAIGGRRCSILFVMFMDYQPLLKNVLAANSVLILAEVFLDL